MNRGSVSGERTAGVKSCRQRSCHVHQRTPQYAGASRPLMVLIVNHLRSAHRDLLCLTCGITAAARGSRSAGTRPGILTRKWILSDLMAERQTAAEIRSFTLRHFMQERVARLAHMRGTPRCGPLPGRQPPG